MRRSEKLHRAPLVAPIFRRVFGGGVFVAEGADWRRERQLLKPAFHPERVRSYAEFMARYTKDMVRYTKDMVRSFARGETRAIDQELTQLTLRIIARTMDGVDLASEVAAIGRSMKGLLTIVEAQLKRPRNPPAWIPTPTNRRQKARLRELSTVLRDAIHARRAAKATRGTYSRCC